MTDSSVSVNLPVPVAALSKASICGPSLAGIAGSNGSLSVVSVVCCRVEVPATDRAFVQRSLIDICLF